MASDYGFMKPQDPAFPNGQDGGITDYDSGSARCNRGMLEAPGQALSTTV